MPQGGDESDDNDDVGGDSDHDDGSAGAAIVPAEESENEEEGNESDLVMLSDTEVMAGESHPFQVLLDEDAGKAAEAAASGAELETSLDEAEDSQVSKIRKAMETAPEKTVDLCCIEDSPVRPKKTHKFAGSPSPYRKFKELNARLRMLKLKQSQRNSGSNRKDCMILIRAL